ncbi:hypothetical protein TWF718_008379 [Orbilia javanica]|uniref:DUF4246 domain-containing protein n=1 Tax=Orbilia javanica TaxID=47235 RepID=A0AAN8RHA3_9PEZI
MSTQERKKPYPHVLDLARFRFKDLHNQELSIRAASLEFRDLPDWTEKLKDRKFVTDWLRGRQQQDFEEYDDVDDPYLKPLVWGRDDVTMWFNELAAYKHYVRRLRKQGVRIEPDAEAVWRVDGPVGEGVRRRLVDGAALLENALEDQTVIQDILDPSMWPIIYGKTTTVDGYIIQGPDTTKDEDLRASNPNYCWLPSEFKVSEDGGSTKITSYVNNISSLQQESTLLPIFEKVFTAFVPLFNHVLAETERQLWTLSRCIDPTPWKSRVNDGVLVASKDACVKASNELLDQMETSGQMKDTFEGIGVPASPRPDGCSSMFPVKNSLRLIPDAIWKPPKISKFNRLEGRTAKVIVSMVNIMLSPENPEYQAGGWSLNGFRNERIIATGVYFYDQENITETYLSLRRKGFGRHKPTTREIERVRTKQNRAIVYPNFYQHRISSFNLLDKSKPGHTKMLIFHYCDPSEPHTLQTTTEIHPQQPNHFEDLLRNSKLGSLPEEVFSQILAEISLSKISLDDARGHRWAMINWKESWVHDGDGYYSEHERDHYYGSDPNGYGFAYSGEED